MVKLIIIIITIIMMIGIIAVTIMVMIIIFTNITKILNFTIILTLFQKISFPGVFSWGVYYGYGLAFVFGIYITKVNKTSAVIFKI